MRRASNVLGSAALALALTSDAVRASSSPGLAGLEWLVGDWRADFDVPDGDGARPTMTWSWGGPTRDFLRHRSTRPTADGRLVPEYESFVVWHPTREKLTYLTVYLGDSGDVVGDGTIEILEDGAVRLHMSVHYPEGARLPFSGDATAERGGHTLSFRRTFRQDGENRLRGFFVIQRGGRWENPHPNMTTLDKGFTWVRVGTRERSE